MPDCKTSDRVKLRLRGFSSQSATLNRISKIKKILNDASIKNFLCRINVVSSMLLVAMADVRG